MTLSLPTDRIDLAVHRGDRRSASRCVQRLFGCPRAASAIPGWIIYLHGVESDVTRSGIGTSDGIEEMIYSIYAESNLESGS